MKKKLLFIGLQALFGVFSWFIWRSNQTPWMPEQYWWHKLVIKILYIGMCQFGVVAIYFIITEFIPAISKMEYEKRLKLFALGIGIFLFMGAGSAAFGYINDNYLHWQYTDYSNRYNYGIDDQGRFYGGEIPVEDIIIIPDGVSCN